MAEIPEGTDPPKPPPAAIPDLKAQQVNKPADFAWTPPPPVAKAAASAANLSTLAARGRPPTGLERLNSTPGRLAVMAVLMLVAGAGLSLTAFHDNGGTGGGTALGGLKSTIKIPAVRGQDSTFLQRTGGRDDAGKDRMAVKAGAKDDIAQDTGAGGAAGAGGAGGDAPMNYDDGPASRGAGVSGAAGAQGAGKDGAADGAGGEGGTGGGAAGRLSSSSYGKINFQGMRRVSGTAGFRGIQGRRGGPNKTIQTRGSSSNSTVGGADGGANGSGVSSSGGKGSSGGGVGPGGKAGARSGADSGTAGGGGGGGGGAGEMDISGLDGADQNLPSIAELMGKAASAREDADKEEKRAKILAAGGHLPQAAYHYDKSEKKKKEADEYEAQANEQTNAIKDQIDGLTPPP